MTEFLSHVDWAGWFSAFCWCLAGFLWGTMYAARQMNRTFVKAMNNATEVIQQSMERMLDQAGMPKTIKVTPEIIATLRAMDVAAFRKQLGPQITPEAPEDEVIELMHQMRACCDQFTEAERKQSTDILNAMGADPAGVAYSGNEKVTIN